MGKMNLLAMAFFQTKASQRMQPLKSSRAAGESTWKAYMLRLRAHTPNNCSRMAAATATSSTRQAICKSRWVCRAKMVTPKRKRGMAMVNRPRKAQTYSTGGLGISSPVTLHSPKNHRPAAMANRPSHKKAVPFFSKRVTTRAIKNSNRPSPIRIREKKKEGPPSQTCCNTK